MGSVRLLGVSQCQPSISFLGESLPINPHSREVPFGMTTKNVARLLVLYAVLAVTLFGACTNQSTPADKFEQAVKCRELADKYSNPVPPLPESNSIVTTIQEVIYKESRKTCLARVNLVIRIDETIVSSTDQVRDILTNKVLASSSGIGGHLGHWYYDNNNVQQEADEQKVRAVMDELMRE